MVSWRILEGGPNTLLLENFIGLVPGIVIEQLDQFLALEGSHPS
jgi:hypothetical protein